MRCRACDKPVQGERELCSTCGKVSQYNADVPVERPPETLDDMRYFHQQVVLTGVGKSWLEGLGLMDPLARHDHLRQRAVDKFVTYREQGMSQYMAFAKATGLANRGNQRFATPGTGYKNVQGSGTSGEAVGSDPETRLTDHQSYEFLW